MLQTIFPSSQLTQTFQTYLTVVGMASVLRRVMVASIIAAFVHGKRENRCRKSVSSRNTFGLGTGTKKLLMTVSKLNLALYKYQINTNAKIYLRGDEILLRSFSLALCYKEQCRILKSTILLIQVKTLNEEI